MKITNVNSLDKEDYRKFYQIKVNGKTEVSFCDGEPEDNNMGRNFCGVNSITRLMKMAYEAGKNGEPFEVDGVDVEWGNWD